MNISLDKVKLNTDKLTPDIDKFIKNIFRKHVEKVLGNEIIQKYEGTDYQYISLNIDTELIGAITFRNSYGTLDIKYLAVSEKYRGNNFGKTLMEKAFEIGKNKLKCKTAYLSTFSFQALDFYKKLGFEVEFVRDGYGDNIKNYFLSKKLY